MAGRGYLLALDGPWIALLLAAEGDDRRVIEVIKKLDVTGAPDECGADKAWDGIHRCLTEGRLGSEDGACPPNEVVLGGLPLHQGEGYVVSYNTPAEVREVAGRSPSWTSRRSWPGTGHLTRRSTAPRPTRPALST